MFALLPLLLSLLPGCDQEAPQPIQWQLPLSPPSDPHRGTRDATPPAWAAAHSGEITLRLLSSATARQHRLRIPMGGAVELEGLSIRLLGLAGGLRIHSDGRMFDDPATDNPAAFLRIDKEGRIRFSGWLYQRFPEMFTPDIPGWKFFLDNVSIHPLPAASDAEAPSPRSLSSAG